MSITSLSVLAHIATDFIIQSDDIAGLKDEKNGKGYLKHGLAVFLTLGILLSCFFEFKRALPYSVLVSVIHTAIDYLKSLLNTKRKPIRNLMVFLSDQFLHIVAIFLAYRCYSAYFPLVRYPLLHNLAAWVFGEGMASINDADSSKFIPLMVYILYLTFGGAVFIRLVIDVIYRKVPDYMNGICERKPMDEVKVGKFVGILERTILFFALLGGNIGAVGLIIAAKSLTRFSQLQKKEFAEYYLIGTLLSVVLTLVFVLLFKCLVLEGNTVYEVFSSATGDGSQIAALLP